MACAREAIPRTLAGTAARACWGPSIYLDTRGRWPASEAWASAPQPAVAGRFRDENARALWGGLAAHSFLPLERSPTAAIALVLALAGHACGWPIVRGGSARLAHALAVHLTNLGGEIRTGWRVSRLEELPPARAVLLDLTPRQVIAIGSESLPARYTRRLLRYRYGPAAFKVDYALSGPVPWRDGECARAATVHLGGSLEEIAAAERACWRGKLPERPFVLFAQPTAFDTDRAPPGQHVGWAYAHVLHGWTGDATAAVEAQIERFAPGFGDVVLARCARGPRELERDNPNLVGGDINGGAQDLAQLFSHPAGLLDPYETPVPGLFLCSSSTPPPPRGGEAACTACADGTRRARRSAAFSGDACHAVRNG